MTLDFTKPITTRDGRAVRILCTDGPGECPVVGFIKGATGPGCWYAHGAPQGTNGVATGPDSLINPPVKRRGWVNLYLTGAGRVVTSTDVHETEESAKILSMNYGFKKVATVQLPEWSDQA